jgi:hypothetical protein
MGRAILDMRITAFTCPHFQFEDPERYGVRISRAFWKAIAFVHVRTKLCANRI